MMLFLKSGSCKKILVRSMNVNLSTLSSPMSGNFAQASRELVAIIVKSVTARANEHGGGAVSAGELQSIVSQFAWQAWAPELGAMMMSLSAKDPECPSSWFHAQLQCFTFLFESKIELELDYAGARPLVFAGLPLPAGRIRASGRRGKMCFVWPETSERIEFHRRCVDEDTYVWVRSAREPLIAVGSAMWARVGERQALERWWRDMKFSPALTDPRPGIAQVEAATAVLENHLPQEYLWVGLMLREVMFSQSAGTEVTESSSINTWPGHVQMSLATVVQTICMLIHECSHQYFHLVNLCAPVVDDDSVMAFSVLKQKSRPLGKVLLGYHAFANIELALRRLREVNTGLDIVEIERQINHARHHVDSLEQSLESVSQHVMPAGAAMYSPLQRQLAAARSHGCASNASL